MKYTTLIKAIDPQDGVMKTWSGPDIEADSQEAAEEYCQLHGLGYCIVDGSIRDEFPDMDEAINDLLS